MTPWLFAYKVAVKKADLTIAELNILETLRDRDEMDVDPRALRIAYFIECTNLGRSAIYKGIAGLIEKHIIEREGDGREAFYSIVYDPTLWVGAMRPERNAKRIAAARAAENGNDCERPVEVSTPVESKVSTIVESEQPHIRNNIYIHPKGNRTSSVARESVAHNERLKRERNESQVPPPPTMPTSLPVSPDGSASPPVPRPPSPQSLAPRLSPSLSALAVKLVTFGDEMNYHMVFLRVEQLAAKYGELRVEPCLNWALERATKNPLAFAATILASGDEPWLATGDPVTTVADLESPGIADEERDLLRFYLLTFGMLCLDQPLDTALRDLRKTLALAARILPGTDPQLIVRQVIQKVAADPFWGPKKMNVSKFLARFGTFVNLAKTMHDDVGTDVNEIIRQRKAARASTSLQP